MKLIPVKEPYARYGRGESHRIVQQFLSGKAKCVRIDPPYKKSLRTSLIRYVQTHKVPIEVFQYKGDIYLKKGNSNG